MGKKRSLFTVGYEGRTVTEFIKVLQENGVARVLDVRELPLSRRRGFSKTALRDSLEAQGIEYVHLREAGNPYRRLKANLRRCLELYRGHLSGRPDVLTKVVEASEGGRTALLCVEADPSCCHRSIIAEGLKHRRPAYSVVDL